LTRGVEGSRNRRPVSGECGVNLTVLENYLVQVVFESLGLLKVRTLQSVGHLCFIEAATINR